jgi:carbon-monoxide dehydrogenase medium subunit
MTISDLKIHTPNSIPEALELLSEVAGARIMAGGTDLLVDLKQGLTHCKEIVSLSGIDELHGIREEGASIRIGALVTAQELVSNPVLNDRFPALVEAARSMASYQIRTMATVGGNICSAVPSADLPPSLISADATVLLHCEDGERELPISDFFTGPRETVCRMAEVLTATRIPDYPSMTGVAFEKFAHRNASALAVASVASRISVEEGTITKGAVVLGAVAPTPLLAEDASALLTGEEPSEALFREAARVARDEAKPITDIRGSAWFRKELVEVLTYRTLTKAFQRASAS